MTGKGLPKNFYKQGSGHLAAVRMLKAIVGVLVLLFVIAIASHLRAQLWAL
jgi:hypothetical protein